MIAALATPATLAPRKKAIRPTLVDGRSAPIVIATAIVPGPVVRQCKRKEGELHRIAVAALLPGVFVALLVGMIVARGQ